MSATLSMGRAITGLYARALTMPVVHKGELLSVQCLRGLATLMVLEGHTEDVARHLQGWEGYQSLYMQLIGYSAPDLFFVVSGFIMSYITFRTRFDARRWLITRFIRIYPIYTSLTLVVMCMWLYNPRMTMGSGEHTWGSVIQSLLLLPQAKLPLLFVGWTMEHEIVFYAAIFLTLRYLDRQWLYTVLTALSGLALLKWTFIAATGWEFWDFHIASLYMVQFTMGAFVYRFWERLQKLGTALPAMLFVGFMGLGAAFAQSGEMNREEPLRVLAFGAAYSCLLLAALNFERRRQSAGIFPTKRSWAVWIGDASYSIYLTHPFVLGAFGKVFLNLSVSHTLQWVWVAAAWLTALGVGMISHILLERPVIELGKWLSEPSPTPRKAGHAT